MPPFSASFLDRDGTLIRDTGYPSRPSEVEMIPGAADAIARLNGLGVPVILVTNQSGIGRGLLTEADFLAVQAEIAHRLAAEGARLDAVYHCPHDPERTACGCRKPAGGMFEQAAAELDIDLEEALFVGDRRRDLAFGIERGGTAILIDPGQGSDGAAEGAARAPDLATAVERALRRAQDSA